MPSKVALVHTTSCAFSIALLACLRYCTYKTMFGSHPILMAGYIGLPLICMLLGYQPCKVLHRQVEKMRERTTSGLKNKPSCLINGFKVNMYLNRASQCQSKTQEKRPLASVKKKKAKDVKPSKATLGLLNSGQ